MELKNFTYLGLLILTLAYPLYKSFEPKIQFYKKFKYILPSIIITAIPFLIWDVIFEHNNIWSFNPEYTIGFNILGLPIEEWMFFFIIPFACFFIYEVVKYFSKYSEIPYIRGLTIAIALFLFVASLFFVHLDYTFTTLLLGSLVLLIILSVKPIHAKLSSFFKGYVVSLIPFFLVNGVLTKMPVVLYNNSENLSLRIYTIPIEDMVYLLILLFINFTLYETFRLYAQGKAS
jgi:lycopene cyclase domain-containing protein